MAEGDIVYYESAKCLHGRMAPLQGGFYVNLFAHYRPKVALFVARSFFSPLRNHLSPPTQIIYQQKG